MKEKIRIYCRSRTINGREVTEKERNVLTSQKLGRVQCRTSTETGQGKATYV